MACVCMFCGVMHGVCMFMCVCGIVCMYQWPVMCSSPGNKYT